MSFKLVPVSISPRVFNEKTSLVIGLPMTTATYNADNPFAVAVGKASGLYKCYK
jgi:mRNA interferase MazF